MDDKQNNIKKDPDSTSPSQRESLEVRVVAMLLGEASEFELAELSSLLAEDPDLREFANRIALTHGLAQQALSRPSLPAQTGDSDTDFFKQSPPFNEWKLPKDKRERLFQKLGIRESYSGSKKSELPGKTNLIRLPALWKCALAAAALLILSLLILPVFEKESLKRALAGSGVADPGFMQEEKTQDHLQPTFEGASGAFLTQQPAQDLDVLTPARRGQNSRSETLFAAQSPPSEQPKILQTEIPPAVMESSEIAKALSESVASSPAMIAAIPSTSSGVGPGGLPRTVSPQGWASGHAQGAESPVGAAERHPQPKDSRRLEHEEKSPSRNSLLQAGQADGEIHYGSKLSRLVAAPPSEMPTEKSSRARSAHENLLFQNATAAQPVSTFSLFVGDVSFQVAQQSLLIQRRLPDPSMIRSEEFSSAFDYGDPAPRSGEPVSLAQDQSLHPTLPSTNLLRLSFRTSTEGRSSGEPLYLTVLLDNSGSMERPDRSSAVRLLTEALQKNLRESDRITIVSFDRNAQLIADQIPAAEALATLHKVQKSVGESGTNLEDALEKVREIAIRRKSPNVTNRVLLITDGVANLGETIPENLSEQVEAMRQNGIALDIVAAGAADVGDNVLQSLARKGDGRYFLLDGKTSDAGELARKLAGAFHPAATNVKLQVRFNPSRVRAWSLLGYETHLLKEEDFRDDSVDAAELAAAEQATALYQLEIQPEGTGEVGVVHVRFLESASGNIVERSWIIPYNPASPPFDMSSPALQLAGTATLFAENLRGTPAGKSVSLGELRDASVRLQGFYSESPRVQTLHQMIQQAIELQ